MDSRFAHLYKRDSSVSMIRVKMSRRRSQSQKENREKMQNLRRPLEQLQELELSLDASHFEKSVLPSQDTGCKDKVDKNNSAVEERRKMLARFKENKALQKEKERREKEKKGTFKVGLYRPQPLGYLPLNPVIPTAKKTTESMQSTRVTRSMKQHLQPKQPAEKQPAPKKAEPPITRAKKSSAPAIAKGRIATVELLVRCPTTRSASKTVTTANSVAKPAADLRPPKTKAASRQPAAPSSGRGKAMQGHTDTLAAEKKENKVADEVVAVVNPPGNKEEKMTEDTNVTPVSFAPQGFVFQAPSGLRTFQPTPLSPRSADAFLSPSFSVEPQMEPTNPISPTSDSSSGPPLPSPPPCMSKPCPASVPTSAPSFEFNPTTSALPTASSVTPSSLSCPPPASPPPALVSSILPSSSSPPAASPSSATSEPHHDVPYFRAVMASETERLTGLSEFWELRFEDSLIPEEMRDRMRTAVGQARLLIKERFGQFSGLVDDCDFGRGEKITTCTDLQGFWDMVYFQVEDVDKKFNALKEAEARGWQEEIKPVTRQKKVVKQKPPAAGGKLGAGAGASAAAKSRLAAVKAAMKAKQAAAKTAEASDKVQDDTTPASNAPANTLPVQTVVFHGGFFQVESPIKVVDAVRRSSRLNAATFTQCSPHGYKFSTPGKLKRSAVVTHSSPLPCIFTPSKSGLTASLSSSPAAKAHTTATPVCTPKQHADPLPPSSKPIHISPGQDGSAPYPSPKEVSDTQLSHPDHHTSISNIQSDLMITPDDHMYQTADIKPHNSPCHTEELPLQLPAHPVNNTEPERSVQQTSALSQEQTEGTVIAEVDMIHSDSQAHAMSFTHSPSACKTTPQAESMESCVSVPCSPSVMSTTPQQVQVSPAPSGKTDICVDERSISADCKVTENQERETILDLDFERYLQPTARCSLSPVQSMAVERFSLGLEDAEMESPQAHHAEPVQDAQMTPTAFPRMAPLLVTPWTEEMIADQLLFTPELRERVRQSVCDRDLMMFTPPEDI